MGIKINAVFEGGGVKAVGLVGGVKAAEEKGVEFCGLAGTSSGSIVASFLAAGYTAEEMRKMIMDTPFTSFLKESSLHRFRGVGHFIRLFIKKGLYSGQLLEEWVREQLNKKGVRTFGDLGDRQLKIVASDISQGKLLVLPNDIAQYGMKPERMDIARAVRMSTSIPYFFDPVVIRKQTKWVKRGDSFKSQFIYIVDGGILSNFPLWIFDKPALEKNKKKDWDTPCHPTIGFSLVGRHSQIIREIYGPLSMFQALFATMMEAHDERYIEKYNRFRTVKIPTLGVHTTEFNIPLEKSLALYESGLSAGRQFFSRWNEYEYQQYFAQYLKEMAPI